MNWRPEILAQHFLGSILSIQAHDFVFGHIWGAPS
jgi:hypothetical protein